jgi:hypothetical protein
VSAAYNRGKPPCVCIFFFLFFFHFPHLRSENIFTTYTHGPRSQKAAYAYESPFFFFFFPVFVFFKKLAALVNIFPKGAGSGSLTKREGGKKNE